MRCTSSKLVSTWKAKSRSKIERRKTKRKSKTTKKHSHCDW